MNIFVEYEVCRECRNRDAIITCRKCGRCGRKFVDGTLVNSTDAAQNKEVE